jgi:glutamine amidotransferase-like uncharacterized protein
MACGGRGQMMRVPEQNRVIRVALYIGEGTIARSYTAVEKNLGLYDGVEVTRINVDEIQSGKLVDYDILIMPGGSGGGQASALGSEGRKQVKEYVNAGGGFIGICAGGYLGAMGWNDATRELELVNARLHDLDNWARGKGTVVIEITGSDGAPRDEQKIWFENGPIYIPGNHPDLPAYHSLATFKTDMHAAEAPAGEMMGRDAIVCSKFGKGRVVLFSIHPELTEGIPHILYNAVRWVSSSHSSREGESPFQFPIMIP